VCVFVVANHLGKEKKKEMREVYDKKRETL
jgi:hypothetical protein